MKDVLKVVKEFFKSRALGFWFTTAAVILSVARLSVYIAGFTLPAWESYFHWTVVFFSVVAIAAGIALSVFDTTAPYAAAATTLFEFLSFLMFMRYGYMYFSQIFFGGISLSLFFQMHFGYLWCILLYVAVFGIGIAGMFLKQSKKEAERQKETVTVGGEE